MKVHQLLLLLCLLAKQTKGKEQLMDYLQSHVMISVEYLTITHKKAMEKVGAKVIRETCHKKREENMVRKFATYFIINEQASHSAATKSAKVDFEYNWSTIVVKEVR